MCYKMNNALKYNYAKFVIFIYYKITFCHGILVRLTRKIYFRIKYTCGCHIFSSIIDYLGHAISDIDILNCTSIFNVQRYLWCL